MKPLQQGMSLIELTVVLLILVALAGLTVPYIGGTTSKVRCDATDVSMANIKRAIMDRYYLDTLGSFPATKGGTDYSVKYLFESGGWGAFNPDTQIGWRGNYLQLGTVLSSITDLSSNFTNTTYVHVVMDTTQTVVLDAWQRPIILQVNSSVARLVSAGFDGVLETTITGNRATGNDDRILYLNAASPSTDINPSCN